MSFPQYAEYKGSGVEWLGETPAHWAIQRVKTLFRIKKQIAGDLGFDVLSITQRGIRIKDIESNDGQLSMDYSKYQLVEVGDFAMNHMDLLTGYVDIAPVCGVTSPDYRVFSIRDGSSCCDQFFLRLFQNGYNNRIFFPYGQGSSHLGRWRLPTEQFNNFLLPVPPTKEQRAIASFLDHETAKIDTLAAEQEKLITLLKEKRQALISHVVTNGLDPNVPTKDSGIEWLGQMPAHWSVTPLKWLTDPKRRIMYGIVLPGPDVGEGVPILKGGNVKKSRMNLESMARTTPEIEAPYARARLNPGDLVYSIRGSIGDCESVPEELDGSNITQDVARIAVAAGNCARWVRWALLSSAVREELASGSLGAAVRGVNIFDLKRADLPTPPEKEQRAIAEFLDAATLGFDAMMTEAQLAIDLLKERRSALISAAVTGKIDVRDFAKAEAA